jgi:hypothetical protein
MHRLVQGLNQTVALNDADPLRPNVVTVNQAMTATPSRRQYLLSSLRLGHTEIVRMSTPLDEAFSEGDMRVFVALLADSHVWGLNLGEFRASDRAWKFFGEHIPQTRVGFAWINERGKDIGACTDMHDWLLGIGPYALCGILRGQHSPLAQNRKKMAHPVPAWYDQTNPTVHHALAKKFLFNPHNSVHFR